MLNDYTNYVLAKRRNAIVATMLFAMIPLLNIIAFVTLNFVTLERGKREGADLLIAITVVNIILACFSYYYELSSDIRTTIEMIIYFNFCSYAAALLLREFNSWYLTLECLCYLGLIIILITYMLYPNLTDYYMGVLQQQLALLKSVYGEDQIQQIDLTFLKAIAHNAIGFRALGIICSLLFYLVIARWVQTRRNCPGQLRKELHLLRADYISMFIVGAVMIGSYYGIPAAQNMHIVAILPMVCTGLSIVHNFSASRKHWFLLLMSFYLVFSMFDTLIIGVLIFLAILDLFIDIRGKYDGYNIARAYTDR